MNLLYKIVLRSFYLLIVCTCPISVLSQNLVPNGDLEKFTSAGTIGGTATYGPNFPYADAWVNPQSGSPEYYQVGINAPNTFCCGYRTAHSGTGFKGIDTWGFGEGEHVEAKLTQPLIAGKEYFVSFWLVQSTHYPASTDNFGAHFSNTYWTGNGPPATQNAYWQGFYPDTTWRMFYSIYTATGGEEFITLGMVPVPWPVTTKVLPGFSGTMGYMFLDDVCVYDMSEPSNYTLYDTSICTSSYPITLSSQELGVYYYWNTGDTTPSVSVNADGIYWRRTYLPCSYRVDTFKVSAGPLFNDTAICNGDTISVYLGSPNNLLTVLSGDFNSVSCNNCIQNSVYPKETTVYMVSGECYSDPDTFTVQVNNYLDINAGLDIIKCVNDTALILINTSGGNVNDFYFEWFPGTYLTNDTAQHPQTYAPQNISYSVRAENKTGPKCPSFDVVNVQVIEPSFTVDSLICTGENLQIVNTTKGSPIAYNWYFGDGNYSNEHTPTHSYSHPGVYTISLITPPCLDTVYKKVIVDSPLLDLGLFKDKDKICIGESVYFNLKMDSTIVSLHWEMGDGVTFTELEEVHHAYDVSGTMYVRLTAGFRACPDMSSIDSIQVFPFPKVDLHTDSVICLHGHPIILSNLHPHYEGYKYLWSTGDTTSSLKIVHQGYYNLTVSNEQGCSTTEWIKVDKDCYVDIPNAFTPNGDGVNDYFFPRQLLSGGVTEFTMQILNRWGQLIFETNSVEGKGWDGKFNETNQPMGVYIYIIDVEYVNGKKEYYKGNVTLIR